MVRDTPALAPLMNTMLPRSKYPVTAARVALTTAAVPPATVPLTAKAARFRPQLASNRVFTHPAW